MACPFTWKKKAILLQTKYWSVFSWKKTVVFSFKFHQRLLLTNSHRIGSGNGWASHSHYLNRQCPNALTHICVTKYQWVDGLLWYVHCKHGLSYCGPVSPSGVRHQFQHGWGNGLSRTGTEPLPWANADLLTSELWRANFSEIIIKTKTFCFRIYKFRLRYICHQCATLKISQMKASDGQLDLHVHRCLILGLPPANERRRYIVTTSFIVWAQA